MNRSRLVDPAIGGRQYRYITQMATLLVAFAASDLARSERRFELIVVDPAGKPVPNAAVQIRSEPVPTADDAVHGEFVSSGDYGARFKADVAGRVSLRLPADPSRLAAFIEHPAYGPYFAGWESDVHRNSIPETFTAQLEAAWSVGSLIVDDAGRPIEGATVHPSIEFKKRPGDSRQLAIGTTLTTDAAGKWQFESVPASLAEVSVEINHPRFMPQRRALTRGEFGLAAEQPRRQPIVLDRGLTMSGRVTDDAGNPIAGALVRAKFINNVREATTDDEGDYVMVGCEPRMARVVASAKGRAMDLQEVRVAENMEPIDFELQPGGRIRVRIVDAANNPVPKTRIFFQRWRGSIDYFEFDHVHDYADENGVWEWNEAPLDEIKADICPPDGMQLLEQSLVAREEEYVFRPSPKLVVSGAVIDADTKEPIKSFRVTPGLRYGRPQTQWVNAESADATGGKYQVQWDRGYDAHLLRIEAAGYQTVVSREIKNDEGAVTIDFELTKGKEAAATVLTPAGAPAAAAKVAIGIAGAQISVDNGDIDDTSTYAARLVADEAGRIRVPHQNADYQSHTRLVTHMSKLKRRRSWRRFS